MEVVLINETIVSKRKKGVRPWVRELCKKRTELRNKGKTYVCPHDIIKKDRIQKPLEICRMKCGEKIDEDIRITIFQEYWSLGTRDRRVQSISGLVEKREPKTTRKRKLDSTKTREVTYLYYFEINGERENVCKKMFLEYTR